AHGAGRVLARLRGRVMAELWLSVDGYRYDRPDTSVYFDYTQASLQPMLHSSIGSSWGVRVGPRLEWLLAPDVVAERYRQVSLVLEAERLHPGDWLSLSAPAGWRCDAAA